MRKSRGAPVPLTRKDAAAILQTSTIRLKRLIDAGAIKTVPPKGRVLPEELEQFKARNTQRISDARAEVLHAYEIGLSMDLVEIVAANALLAKNVLLPGKTTAKQFTYQTVYAYVMNKEENNHGR